MYNSGIELPKVSFSSLEYDDIPAGGYFIGFDLDNAGKLSKIDNTGTITVIEQDSSGGTVTSVGLDLPAAFTVSNSPIISSGDIVVTGAGLASQYIRGDGTLASFPDISGGGGGQVYYFNGEVDQGIIDGDQFKQVSTIAVINTGVDFISGTTDDVAFAHFITDIGKPTQETIPAGVWIFQCYLSASLNTCEVYASVEVYDGSTFTALSTSIHEVLTGGNSIDLYTFTCAVPEYTPLTTTDRIVIRFYPNNLGGSETITLHTQDSHLSSLQTTFTTGIAALNGLTSSAQYLQVGTSGSDFNITTAGTDTHILNLPTSNASTRGLLSSTDWSSFNSKIDGLGTTNYITKFTASGTVGNSSIQDNGTTIGMGGAPISGIKQYIYNSTLDKSIGLGNTYSKSGTTYGIDINTLNTNSLGSSTGINIVAQGRNGSYGINSAAGGGNAGSYQIGGYFSANASANALTNIGIWAIANTTTGGNRYAAWLQDGTEAADRILKSDSQGRTNWTDLLTINGNSLLGTGNLSISAAVNEAKAIYIDATYGNNSTGTKYDVTKPFLTWAAAQAVAVAGDWLVLNAGSYSIGTVTPVSNVNVYCKPGVIIDGGFSISSSLTWRFLGSALFLSTTDTLRIVGSGQTYDIQFEFDRIEGLLSYGIITADITSPLCKILINCNSIIASAPIRFGGGAFHEVVVNCKNKISSFGSQAIITGNSTANPMLGTVVINCPVIETTSTASNRTVINLQNPSRNVTINSSIIRSTSTTFTDSGISNLGCLVFAAGDNCIINGNLDGGPVPCIISNTSGSTPTYGNTTFIGNMYSDREIVQHYQKASNGNGWQNIIIKNGYISSKGIGSSDSMFHRANAWNSVHNGIPGNIQLVDCTVYNQNFNASATASIMKDDVVLTGTTGWVIKRNNFQMFNCLAYIQGTVGYLVSTIQSNKETMLHNVRSNIDKMATVTDLLTPTGLIVDANMIIPKTKL